MIDPSQIINVLIGLIIYRLFVKTIATKVIEILLKTKTTNPNTGGKETFKEQLAKKILESKGEK